MVATMGGVIVETSIVDPLARMDRANLHLYSKARQSVVALLDDSGKLKGNGFFFSRRPLIFTAKHVVENDSEVKALITLEDGQSEATFHVIHRFDNLDLAILRGVENPTCYTGPSKSISTGDIGYIIAYGLDLNLKFSSGILSVDERENDREFGNLGVTTISIATHADSGCSGSPVFGYDGLVKGMVLGFEGKVMFTTRVVSAFQLEGAVQIFLSSGSEKTFGGHKTFGGYKTFGVDKTFGGYKTFGGDKT